MANSKQIDVPLCEICASTFFCTITQFDHYSPDTQKLAQSLGMAFNILRQDIRAALPVPPTHPTMQKAMTRVVQAARAVVQWDWSDNDADCVADMDKLTKAIADLDALNAALGGVTPE